MTAVVAMLALAACGGAPPTIEECGPEMEKARRFFSDNQDKYDALLAKHNFKAFMQQLFSSQDLDIEEYEQTLERFLAESLKMAGADAGCARVIAGDTAAQLKKDLEDLKELMEAMEELDDLERDYDEE